MSGLTPIFTCVHTLVKQCMSYTVHHILIFIDVSIIITGVCCNLSYNILNTVSLSKISFLHLELIGFWTLSTVHYSEDHNVLET
jgi:hypothetical protein